MANCRVCAAKGREMQQRKNAGEQGKGEPAATLLYTTSTNQYPVINQNNIITILSQ